MAGETTSKTIVDEDQERLKADEERIKQEQAEREKLLYGRARQIINLNGKRYRGLGKARRLKRDINKSKGEAFIWDGSEAKLSGLTNPNGMSWDQAKELLDNRSKRYHYNPYTSYDTNTADGLFNSKVANYFEENSMASHAKWDPHAAEKAKQKKKEPTTTSFFSGFGGNDQYLNQLYETTSDKAQYDRLLSQADTSGDGVISPEELNAYGQTWFKNSPFMQNGQIDPMSYLFQRQMGATNDQLKAASGYYTMPVWYNWKDQRDEYAPSTGWSKYDENTNSPYNQYLNDKDVYREFLRKRYNLDDVMVNQLFGQDYASALRTIGYTPQQGKENYFDKHVMDKFDSWLQDNAYNSNNWKFENQRWNYVRQNKKGGVLNKMENINFYQKGGRAKQKPAKEQPTKSNGQQSQEEMLQRAVFGFIGYAASQQQEVTVDDAVKQVVALMQQDPDSLQQIADNDKLVDAGYQAASQKEPEVTKQITQPGVITQVVNDVVQQEIKAARRGAKLNFIRGLKGDCPDGYYKSYFKAGGELCPVCKKKQEEREKVQSAKCGKKMKKGAISKAMNGIRTEMFQNGGTAKKKPSQNIQVKTAKAPDGTIMKRTIIPTINPANNDTIYSERVYYPGLVDENGKHVEGSGGYAFEPAGVYHWDGEIRTEDKNYKNLKNKFGKARIINTKNIPFTNNNADRYRGFSYTE